MSVIEKLSLKTRVAILFAAMTALCPGARGQINQEIKTIHVNATGFTMGATNLICDGVANPFPFNQSSVKQSSALALQGPNPKIPYFTVRFAMPIPPENLTNNFAALTGIDPEVFTHNHSPGFEILPNGDALAVYFSTPPGKAEADPSTSFVQARLRYGSVEWDMPELFFKTEGYNDQSGLLWNDNGTIRFFGGGRGLSDFIPFKMATSTDNGATWKLSLPQLNSPATNFTAQPITSAFRDGPAPLLSSLNSIYFAMDGDGAKSFLWRSDDNGIHWQQMAGRTGGRHSVIVPLDDKGDLLSIGGKNASTNGWSPENFSTNCGVTWSQSIPSPFPPLGSGQRPSLIRLADGNLFFVSDAYLHKLIRPPPTNWNFGNGAFVAISTNNGTSWRIKTLPVQLPNHERGTNGTLGYVTARQAPNGVIHILTTETQPCLHYELNEAWIFSDAGDIAPENSDGIIKKFETARATWSARICPNGRYLLDGLETDYYSNRNYENPRKEYQVNWVNGRKTGEEIFWAPNERKIWTWQHNLENNTATWTQFWPNGKRKLESNWNTKPTARDLNRSFFGLVANGPCFQWDENGKLISTANFANGTFAGSRVLPKAGGK
ncbi:MAG TPA: exo-alpha-sialidase [Verrucomicrobiae bacterium]|jgi:antitoxin component YwqK of YwqJK toxin-antitoxin module